MIDSLVIDENKSYVTKSGELRFALHAFSGKVFGPVDLVALDGARRIKFSSAPKNNVNGTGGPEENPPPSEGKGTSLKSGLSMNPDPASAPPIDEEVTENPADANAGSLQLAADTSTASPPGIVINDVFQTKGEFSPASRRMTIKWKQANFIKRLTYPAGSKAISFEIYLDGKLQAGWKRNGPVYLDKDGFAYVPVVSPKGIPHNYKSKVSFHSQGFRTLVKAVDTLKKESAYISKRGLKSLPGARKNKKGEIVTTDGALILGALIKSVGPQKIAHKKSGLAVRTFDNIQWRLQDKETGWIVHRIVKHAGLKVDHHKTRGRSLVPGETSAAGASVRQFNTNVEIVGAAPPAPGRDAFNRLALGIREVRNITDRDVDRAVDILNTGLGNPEERERYVDAIANHLLVQRHVFPVGVIEGRRFHFMDIVGELLDAATEYRNGAINSERFNMRVGNARREIAAYVLLRQGNADERAEYIVNLIMQMRGFAPMRDVFRARERQNLVDFVNMAQALREATDNALPIDVIETIVILAFVFFWTF